MLEEVPCGPNTLEASRSGRLRRRRSSSPGVEAAPKRRLPAGRKATIKASKVTCRGRDAAFSCDLCKSPFVTHPARRGSRPKTSTSSPSPRYRADPVTGLTRTLCNACGLSFEKPKRAPASITPVDPAERSRHEQELQAFSQSMVQLLGDQDARRLCCPVFAKKPCLCLQSYIKGAGGNMLEYHSRALRVLSLLKEAKELGSQKCYDPSAAPQDGKSKKRLIGLGNGQRKSQEFADFVLTNRKVLREELKLCERATQRILGYSNNFLHKRLKTDPQGRERVQRTKGKSALGLLKPILDLSKDRCCMDNCVVMAHSYGCLLQLWRERAQTGQAEARRVLAEMLTPSGGGRCNCYRFIMWVTGCSQSTISKVSEQMKKTGGDREPPPHGLKKWIKENPRRKKASIMSTVSTPDSVLPTFTPTHGVASSSTQGQVMAVASLPPRLLVQAEPSLCSPHSKTLLSDLPQSLSTLSTCSLISGDNQLLMQNEGEELEKLPPGALVSLTPLQDPPMLDTPGPSVPLLQAHSLGFSQLPSDSIPVTNQNSGGANEALKQPISNEYQHSLQLIESSEEDHTVLWAP
ncbi:uncharacterized protein LOC121309755 isoform X2 [Polyodon spathula]|uniref:uncharacterized protein LOC121309755 isoform X2 n=1 Tax=Polyodon spathula TaxID=7913 RepID=UPI001B7EE255|nr:uncharacterized protein LOC121309755 isoform X2 [Polyodon spathula]